MIQNDFISFANNIFYDRKIIEENDSLVQINDDDITTINLFNNFPYKGINTYSKYFNIGIDYRMFKYALRNDTLFVKDEEPFVKYATFFLKDISLSNYGDNIQKYLTENNYLKEIIDKIRKYIKQKKINIESFYENYHISGVNKNNVAEMSTLIGYKGELLLYKLLLEKINFINITYNLDIQLYWVSKDINDSMNYELLIYIPETGETHAIEVKTTMVDSVFNNLKLSQREFTKFNEGMEIRNKETIYKRLTSYNIVRIYVEDNDIKKASIISNNNNYLKYLNTLVDGKKIALNIEDKLSISNYVSNMGGFRILDDKKVLDEKQIEILFYSILGIFYKNK